MFIAKVGVDIAPWLLSWDIKIKMHQSLSKISEANQLSACDKLELITVSYS